MSAKAIWGCVAVFSVLGIGWGGANYAGVCYSQGRILGEGEIKSLMLKHAIIQQKKNETRYPLGIYQYREWHNDKINWAGQKGKWPEDDLHNRKRWAKSKKLWYQYDTSKYFDFISYDPPLEKSKIYIYPEIPNFVSDRYSAYAEATGGLYDERIKRKKRRYSPFGGGLGLYPVSFLHKITGYAQYLAFAEIGVRLRVKETGEMLQLFSGPIRWLNNCGDPVRLPEIYFTG